MEIKNLRLLIDNYPTGPQTQPKQNRESAESINDNGLTLTSAFTSDHQPINLSENGLKLYDLVRSRETQAIDADATTTEPEQAIRIARQTAELIKKFPSDGLSAQSNLTLNVVKGLLG